MEREVGREGERGRGSDRQGGRQREAEAVRAGGRDR